MKSSPVRLFESLRVASLLWLMPAVLAAQPGEWETLFDGRSLAGWKAAEHPDSIKVVDGVIVCHGPRAHLFYLGPDGNAEFENFELELQAKTEPGANSGVYFHVTWEDSGWPRKQGIEVQVNNHQPVFEKNYIENKKTGSLYGVRNLYKPMVEDGEWFTMNIRVRKPRVEVRLNGKLHVEYIEPANPPVLAAGTTRDHLGQGTFALQCHDEKSRVSYRNIRVRRLPPGEDPTVAKPRYTDQDAQRAFLARENFPLVDFHTHLTGGLTLEQVLAIGHRTGVRAGIASPGGAGRPIHDDATATAFLDATKDEAVFLGLEVDAPEWLTQFTPETRAKFDYILANAATWAGAQPAGDDAQAYVERLTIQAEQAMADGPIDILANAQWLPAALESRRGELWTEERQQRLVAAAVKHGVALEINVNRRQPSEAFIKLAKGAGAKLTFGSDNTGAADYGDWTYLYEMQKAAGLVWRDMWVPGHKPSRAQAAAKR